MRDKIVVHEDRTHAIDGIEWQRQAWVRGGLGHPPEIGAAPGTVKARVDWGRWIADCPEGCGYAIIVSERQPYLLCVQGGLLCNAGRWLRVEFPAERAEIEAELLRRPARHPLAAPTRRWLPGESVAQLRAEREAHEGQEGKAPDGLDSA